MTSPAPAPSPLGAKVRVTWVDTGRGIAITLVALFHATNWLLGAGAHVEWWVEANLVMSSLRMPLFFTLAGLFAGKWVAGAWRPLWRHKIRLYLWVFLVWGAIGSVTYYLGLRMRGAGSVTSSIIQPYVLSPFMPRLELWFIWALAVYFVVAKLTSRIAPGVQVAVAMAGAAVALSGWDTASPGWSGAVKYYGFFLVGMYGRDLVLRLGSTAGRPVLVAAFVVWLAVAVGLWALGWREVLGLYFVNCLLGVLGGIALSRALARFALLRSLGSQTLPIYLAHTPIVILCAVLLSHTGLLTVPLVDVLGPPALAAVAITLALGLHRGAQRAGAGWLYAPPDWFDVDGRSAVGRRRDDAVTVPVVTTAEPRP
ncbi:acyltransferase family protein [Cellulomonas sp. URHB0016]